jgi:glycosyltransferase involved in cell wall biosynthesis
MSRVCLYYRSLPETDRCLPGDRRVRALVRRVLRGKARPNGIDKVFSNLCCGLDRVGVPYQVNLPFRELRSDDLVGVIGRGRYALQGYDKPNPIVAGIALMNHPSEWPTLCDDYPVAAYLQHSDWANDIYKSYFSNRCRVWPVGIDTHAWQPAPANTKPWDFLIYDKIMWNREEMTAQLLAPIRRELARRQLCYRELRYGQYDEGQFKSLLQNTRSMIFLCEHESQGIAYQECLSCGVPVLAWDQGWWLDPNRFAWGDANVPATSVPYFDDRCGLRFRNAREFPERLTQFLDLAGSGRFSPRDYVMENLTVEKSARAYAAILRRAAGRLS